jgi:hypothetical protein
MMLNKIFFVLIEVCGILQAANSFLCYHFLFSRNSPAPINMKIPTTAIIVGPHGAHLVEELAMDLVLDLACEACSINYYVFSFYFE